MVQYSPALDTAFGALADHTRRGILERLGREGASISELDRDVRDDPHGDEEARGEIQGAGLVSTEKVVGCGAAGWGRSGWRT